MYLVVFKAELIQPDSHYLDMAERLRQLAFDEYNCRGFEAINQGLSEIAISRWESLEDIQRWKQDPVHQSAQRLGSKWYKSWQVTITEIVKDYADEYTHDSTPKD